MIKELILMELLDKMKWLLIFESLSYRAMHSYCLKCKKNTENINPKMSKTGNCKTMLLPICAICGSKRSRFIKEQEAGGLLSS